MNQDLETTINQQVSLQFNPAQLISHLPNLVFWKDRDSVFHGCNDASAKAAGLDSPDEIIGKTDFDLPWDAASSSRYQSVDKQVCNDGILLRANEESLRTTNQGTLALIGDKNPIFDNSGACVGLIGAYRMIETNAAANDIFSLINPTDIERLFEKLGSTSCKLIIGGNEIMLNKKESICLLYIIKGLTGKQIADSISRSRRTAEYYIDILRYKLNCRKKSQLATTAIKAGFLNNFQ